MRWGILVVVAACHARLADPGSGPDAHPTPGADAAPALDGRDVDAAPLGPWGAPTLIPTGTNPADDGTMSWGTGEFVYAQNAGGTKHLYTTTYAAGAFGTPALLPFSGTMAVDDESPRFSTDDLTLYFASTRGGASLDIYAVHRATPTGAWGAPALVAGPNTAGTDKWYAPCDSDHYLVIGPGTAANDTDIFEGIVGAAPARVAALSSAASEISTFLTRDCLTAYWASARDGTLDLWTSQRTSVTGAWAAPTKVTDFGIADNEEDPWISADARTFTFAKATTAAPGQKQLYLSVR